ncbi:MAG: hypothetical protein ACYDCL_12900 [Myxococcales bacterium]
MRRIFWTLAPVALGTALALGAASGNAAPTPMRLPELLLEAPAHVAGSSARVEKEQGRERKLDLGDYNLPADRAGQPALSTPASRA